MIDIRSLSGLDVEKENTLRALKDQPLFATHQWRCRLGIHTWLKWREPQVSRRSTWTYIEQLRECGCCGKFERRTLCKD